MNFESTVQNRDLLFDLEIYFILIKKLMFWTPHHTTFPQLKDILILKKIIDDESIE